MSATDRLRIATGMLSGLTMATEVATAEASYGYRFEAVYTGEVLSNVTGGLRTGTRYLDNLDLMLTVDVDEAWSFGTGTLFVYGLYNNGSSFADELVGDLQVTSNIDAPEAWRIYEAWYEFGAGRWSIRTGLYDLNSEFDVNETGGLFLNSSHGIGPDFSQTGENGPSIFPVSSLAVRGDWQTDILTARLAILDGVPGHPDDPASNQINLGGDDGMLIVAELDMPLSDRDRLWAGYWRYTEDFERWFGTGHADDNDGWYLGAASGFAIGRLSTLVFLRVGQADAALNTLSDYLGVGFVVNVPFVSRPEDQVGLAVASAGAGKPYRAFLERSGIGTSARETTWELTYRASINEHFVVQPNIQWVRSPSASDAIDNSLIIGFRFEITI